MIDFEKAVMNAFKDVFPEFEVKNCFFHLCQSVQRKIQENFKKRYFMDKSFARSSRLVAFLAFVPLDEVEDAFYSVTFYIQMNSPELMVVLNYFESTYLGQVVPETEERTTPRFPISFWNHYERISTDPTFPRTSNMVEGFHRAFRTRLSKSKPTVQSYFKAIREQLVQTDYDLDRLEGGITPSKRRRLDHGGLQTICMSYHDYESILDYLFAVAAHFGHDLD